eukprot:365693-Chlamydomonas_euryale.AAC.13
MPEYYGRTAKQPSAPHQEAWIVRLAPLFPFFSFSLSLSFSSSFSFLSSLHRRLEQTPQGHMHARKLLCLSSLPLAQSHRDVGQHTLDVFDAELPRQAWISKKLVVTYRL